MQKHVLSEIPHSNSETHAKLCLAEVAKKLRDPTYPIDISEETLRRICKTLFQWKKRQTS